MIVDGIGENMLILASASPRRKILLESAAISFIIKTPHVDESSIKKDNHAIDAYVMEIAKLKAQDIFNQYSNDTVIGSDTVVVLDDEIIGKPKDEQDAFDMLKKLSGKKHHVYSGVAIISKEKTRLFYEVSTVQMRFISDDEIKTYIQTKEPMDKAGAYAIQGQGAKFVDTFIGNFDNIMGLPLKRVLEELKTFKL